MSFKNQYSFGLTIVTHKGKKVATSLNSSFEDFYKKLDNRNIAYKVGYIPAGFEHRPDLISNLFYGKPTFDWLICYYNNISDPFNELNVGDRILIPYI